MAAALTANSARQSVIGQKSDDQLMAAYGRDDRTAFDELYNRYKDPLYGYLYRNCHDESATGEMFQDVWLRVIAASRQYKPQGRFRSWIFTLAHNRLVDFYRSVDGSPDTEEVVEEALPGGDSPERRAEAHETHANLEAVIGELPFEQRQAFYLREECGLAVKEIAAVQDISVEAAKSRLRYAYARLREALRDKS